MVRAKGTVANTVLHFKYHKESQRPTHWLDYVYECTGMSSNDYVDGARGPHGVETACQSSYPNGLNHSWHSIFKKKECQFN